MTLPTRKTAPDASLLSTPTSVSAGPSLETPHVRQKATRPKPTARRLIFFQVLINAELVFVFYKGRFITEKVYELHPASAYLTCTQPQTSPMNQKRKKNVKYISTLRNCR
jgi:hypothetical protein